MTIISTGAACHDYLTIFKGSSQLTGSLTARLHQSFQDRMSMRLWQNSGGLDVIFRYFQDKFPSPFLLCFLGSRIWTWKPNEESAKLKTSKNSCPKQLQMLGTVFPNAFGGYHGYPNSVNIIEIHHLCKHGMFADLWRFYEHSGFGPRAPAARE